MSDTRFTRAAGVIGGIGALIVTIHEPVEACRGCGIPAVDGLTLFGMVLMLIGAACALLADKG